MTNILTKIKEELESYKDYWNLSKEDKLTLERETINKIKSGKPLNTLSLAERIKNLKEKNKKSSLVDKPLGPGGEK
jgi:hypothetical protein